MDKIVTIELFGQKYSFKAEDTVLDASEIADLLTQEVANVNEQLSDNKKKMNNIAILTLAALNITSEYIKLRRYHADLVDQISERSDSLKNMIDVYLQ